MKINKILSTVLTTAVVASSVAMPTFAQGTVDTCSFKFKYPILSQLWDNKSKEKDYVRIQGVVGANIYYKLPLESGYLDFYLLIKNSKGEIVNKVETNSSSKNENCKNGNIPIYKRIKLDKAGLVKGEKYTVNVLVERVESDGVTELELDQTTSFVY